MSPAPSGPPSWILLPTVGLAGVAAAGWSPTLAGTGGLAALWLTALVAVGVALPVAVAERASALAPPSAVGRLASTASTVVLTLATAAAIAAVAPLAGTVGTLLAVGAWIAAAGLGPRTASVGLAAGAAAAVLAGALAIGVAVPGWTLLEPGWSAWSTWIGPAMVSGLLIGGVGVGHWIGPHAPDPRGAPMAIGLALALLLGLFMAWASAYELDFSLDAGGVGAVVALAVGGFAPLLVPLRGDAPVLHAALGLGATLLLLGPASDAIPAVWGGVVPVGIALVLGLRAYATHGPTRLVLVAGAAIALAGAILAWPGLPSVAAAVVIGLAPVALAWVAGTRTLLGSTR
jgi:hypothetical protein